jgi:hypothetical protein
MDNNQNFDWKVEEYDQPTEENKPEPPKGAAIRAMVFGIISVYFCCAPFFSIMSIVFGALAKKWAAPIIENYPYTGARLFAKAGHITGKIGVILGIIFTVFWAIYFTVLIFAVMLAAIG